MYILDKFHFVDFVTFLWNQECEHYLFMLSLSLYSFIHHGFQSTIDGINLLHCRFFKAKRISISLNSQSVTQFHHHSLHYHHNHHQAATSIPEAFFTRFSSPFSLFSLHLLYSPLPAAACASLLPALHLHLSINLPSLRLSFPHSSWCSFSLNNSYLPPHPLSLPHSFLSQFSIFPFSFLPHRSLASTSYVLLSLYFYMFTSVLILTCL